MRKWSWNKSAAEHQPVSFSASEDGENIVDFEAWCSDEEAQFIVDACNEAEARLEPFPELSAEEKQRLDEALAKLPTKLSINRIDRTTRSYT